MVVTDGKRSLVREVFVESDDDRALALGPSEQILVGFTSQTDIDGVVDLPGGPVALQPSSHLSRHVLIQEHREGLSHAR